MLDVNYEVAHGEIAEVGHEGRGLGFTAQRLRRLDLRFVKQIARAEDHQMRVWQRNAFRYRSADDGCSGQVAGEVSGFVEISLAARGGRAAAQPEWKLIFGEDVSQALDLAGIGCGKDHALALRGKLLDLFHHGGDRSVKAHGGLRGEFDKPRLWNFGRGQAKSVFRFGDPQQCQVFQAAAGKPCDKDVPLLRRKVNVFRRGQPAYEALLVALDDALPPVLLLGGEGGRLVDEDHR